MSCRLIHSAEEPDSVKATIARTRRWCAVNSAPYAIDWSMRVKVTFMKSVSSELSSQRRMALYRNVTPLLMPRMSDRDEALLTAERLLVERGVLRPGDTYAITCGEPMGHPGGTNMLKVCRVS